MHGSVSGSGVLVNAEVDSMGGVIDIGGGIGVKTSPRRAAIEKAQAELRQEYDTREERRRELEFLEKGGNPLDFKFGNTASHSVQSTSLTDQQAEHFVNSEVKDSFALTASPHGDSVESSGRPGVGTLCEPNTADNLLLFDGENESLEGERNSRHPNKRNRTAESERSSQVNTNQNAKETEDSAIFRPYARRNRSRINRDPARSNSTDVVQNCGGVATSISTRGGSRDGKGSITETATQKDKHIPCLSCPSPATSNGNIVSNNIVSNNQLNIESDGVPDAPDVSVGAKDTPPKDDTDAGHGKNSVDLACRQADLAGEKSLTVSTGTGVQFSEGASKAGQETNLAELNGTGNSKQEHKSLTTDAVAGAKGLDSESSHADSTGVDVNNEKDLRNMDKADSNGVFMQKTSRVEGLSNQTGGDVVIVKNENEVRDTTPVIINDGNSSCENLTKMVKIENQGHRSTSELQNELKCSPDVEKKEQSDLAVENDGKVSSVLADNSNSYLCPGKTQASVEIRSCVVNKNASSWTDVTALKHQPSSDGGPTLADAAKEDSILEEARIIQAKRKRIAELSCGSVPMEVRKRSHWDFVLAEMMWLANDFAQERIWKMTAAAQICHRVAFTSRLRFEERIQHGKLKKLASTLANAVLQFWSSVEVPEKGEETILVDGSRTTEKETSKEFRCEKPGKFSVLGVQEYARRFLKYNNSSVPHLQVAAPSTPDNVCDPGILETSWDDQLTEESLFYSVPSGAMEAYRKSIESHLIRCEKSGSSMQEEVETSAYDAAGEIGYNVIAYDEDEGETSTYYLPGAIEFSKSSNLSHKKRKNLMKSHSARLYDLAVDLPYGNYTGGYSQSTLIGKRPATNLNVGSVPTKRMRTASRQRVVSPFCSATAGSLPVPAKTDASSGDTSSFQDEQSSLHGGSVLQKSTEVDSGGNFEKHLPYDAAETSAKPKKKKKAHLGSAYDQAWHLDSTVHGEQKDHWKKRSDSHHYDLNGLYGPHSAKRQKTMKQSVENNFDNSTPITGSIPSPAASQMSNMSNPNKFFKLIGGRDRGRKIKGLKVSAGQQGSGNPWPLFEDQALVVLVHDMGPNWELISDAMNSSLKIKSVYRNPIECKERHKFLMDRNAGDGADSAEDSGTSQSYPSTLPGIPKGSARQLFQRLQGPMEEDALKSHFEKICLIGKKLHYRRTQTDARDSKQMVPVHNSQVMALSQVFPNNLNRAVLTPLDLCEATTSAQDVFPLENPGSHLPTLNQGAAASALPTSGANQSIPGSSGVVHGNLPTSVPPNASVRDGRFSVPRGSLPPDEQHRLQQYNQILSGRNLQQPTLSTPGAVSGSDRGQCLVPGGNSMGVSGVNRGSPLARPGFQGMGPTSMPNTGSMLSPGLVGLPNSGGMHSVVGSSQGNSMLRPREAMQHMMRMQAAQGNSQGISAFNGLSSGYTNQTSSPVQAYPGHLSQQHQISSQQPHVLGSSHHPHLQSPTHATGAQQQAYAIRQRQMHQRYMQQQQQQQQQFPTSGTLMPHVQSQPQVPPISSSPQNTPQLQPHVSSQSLPLPSVAASSNMTPMAQQNPQKPQLPPHGLGRTPQSGTSGLSNQAGKHRQRQPHQPFQQSGRQHPHQRHPTQGQQQNNKLLKGMGRGNMMHQNVSVDPSHLNGLTMAPGMHQNASEKGEPVIPAVQGQPSHSGSAMNTLQLSKPLAPSQSSNLSQQQPKAFAGAPSPSSQQLQQMHLHSDNSIQGQVPPVASANILSSSSQSTTPIVASSNHQHLLPHQKQGNQMQPPAQRILQQNHLGNSDLLRKAQTEQTPRDPQSVINTSQMANASTTTTAAPQPCIESANMRPVVSSAIDGPPKAAETPAYDSSAQNTASKLVSNSRMDSDGSDSAPTFSQGLGQQHLHGGLPSHGLKAGAQREQQQSQPRPQQQQSPPPVQKRCQLAEQQSVQNQPHFPHEQQQSHQQMPQLRAAQGNSCPGPPDAKVE